MSDQPPNFSPTSPPPFRLPGIWYGETEIETEILTEEENETDPFHHPDQSIDQPEAGPVPFEISGDRQDDQIESRQETNNHNTEETETEEPSSTVKGNDSDKEQCFMDNLSLIHI